MICTDYLYICDIYINVLTMNWTQLLSGKRFGMEEYHERKHERTDFQRDYDRLILNRKRFPYEHNNNFKQKRVNAYALKKKEKRARSL